MQGVANKENNPIHSGNGPSMMAPAQGYAYNPLLAGQMPFYAQPGLSYKSHPNSIEELSNSFAGLKPMYASGAPTIINGLPGMSQVPYQDGRTFYQSRAAMQSMPPSAFMMPHFVPYGNLPATPSNMPWNGVQADNGDLPNLARRNSSSSNEEIGPQTPFMNGHVPIEVYKKPVGLNDSSPSLWNTPSPYSLTYGITMPQQLWKQDGEYVTADYDSLCSQAPAIPRPVPAIFSSEKSRGTLDKCLKNDTNTTNVYIRGLHPDTTDGMLEAYGTRFGGIMSAKSMLDQATGLCKGFGFIKYHNFDDGENCIRGFFHMGYEAKWARVSHNERLKTLADENNTNLYISNLPMSFNEQMLMSVFAGYEVMSSKILRDENGISRGVGFARFASPTICAEIISKYNGHEVADGCSLSIRFADTPDQKKLKSLTAERRQFKTHEYNTAAYGPGSPYAAQASPLAFSYSNSLPNGYAAPLNPVQPTMVYNAFVPAQAHAVSNNGPTAKTENFIPSAVAVHRAHIRTENPGTATGSKRVAVEIHKDSSHDSTGIDEEDEEDTKEEVAALKAATNPNSQIEKRISPSKSVRYASPPRSVSIEIGSHTTPSKTPRSKRI